MLISELKRVNEMFYGIKVDKDLANGFAELSLKFQNIFGSNDQFIEVYKHLLDKRVYNLIRKVEDQIVFDPLG